MQDAEAPDADLTPTERAFRDLLDRLRAAGETVATTARGLGEEPDPEGYRHILRLVSAAIDLDVERADPLRPLFTTWMSETRKFLGDNPDTIYRTAPVAGGSDYVLRVIPGNAVYVGFVVYGRDDNGWRVVSSANDTDLTQTGEGTFELRLSAEHPDNDEDWLTTDPSAQWVMIREYFADRDDKSAATLSIERVGAGTNEPAPLDAGDFARRVASMGEWIDTQVAADSFLASIQRDHPNTAPEFAGVDFPPELVAAFLPTPDIEYQGCAFDLGESDSLVVRGVAPDARYWGLQVMNHWLESTDAPSARNSFQVEARSGESFEFILTERDPCHPGWIPLNGRHRGLLAFRALMPVGEVRPLSFELRQVEPP